MQTLYRELSPHYLHLIGFLVDTPTEVAVLDDIFGRYGVESVLDIACGVGRHAVPLAKKGYDVTGIDYSPHQLKEAEKLAAKEHARVRFLQRDANAFRFQETFHAAICMWSTLGEEPLRYRDVLRNAYRSLDDAGIFVFDNRSWLHLPKEREQVIRDAHRIGDLTVRQELRDRYTENFRIREAETFIGEERYIDLCVTHLLREKDWIRELKEAGFRTVEVWHDYRRRRLRRPKRLLIVAQK